MFEQFFLSMQQDIKLFLVFPILCAIFRAIFIKVYSPYPSLKGRWKVVWHCFRYGFWWGMDFNAYVFLLPLVLVSIPGLFITSYHALENDILLYAGLVYALVLYAAFVGKMIFYNHFHDTYNQIVRLGAKAEKHNLVDVFFHQDHGLLFILAGIPYGWIVKYWIMSFLALPSIPYPAFTSSIGMYIFNILICVGIILGFYWFRYGGTFWHDNKPEWDTIPSIVKKDIFFAKATVDDLVALEQVKKHKLNDAYTHSDEEDLESLKAVLPVEANDIASYPNPVYAFRHIAKGPRIKKPSHIFLIVGESYLQQLFDPAYDSLNLTSGGKRLMNDVHTAVLSNSLSSGIISRPSIVSLMSGIFDAGLELNEKETFWKGTVPTAFPLQLKKLGYTSTYWYGGNVTYGNFNQFAPACGFDRVMTATDFCGPKAPKTWVGVYDNVFLDKAAELIQQTNSGKPEFHFVYTTSYHGPFKINLKKYGYNTESVMPDAPDDIKHNKSLQENLGTFWLSDQAIGTFNDRMRAAYPDSLFIVTADHAINMTPLQHTSIMNRDCSIREQHCPVFMVYHKDLDQHIFAGNTIGGHMNIMPTVIELIAPKGFTYYSLFSSLTEPIDHLVTPYHWLRPDAYGTFENEFYQPLGKHHKEDELCEGPIPYVDECTAWKNLTGYMVRHPELLQKKEDILQQ